MKIHETKLEGVRLIEPSAFADDRGYFMELWNDERYGALGVHATFRQDNLSFSRKGVLRGLHAQNPRAQAKLVSCLSGEIWDVAVDLRLGSPTFGAWHAEVLSSDNHRQLFIPAGFAHGFVVTSETASVSYKCTDLYSPQDELSVVWDDPDVGIRWPVTSPLLSPKDARASRLRDVPRDRLFAFPAVSVAP